MQRQFAFLLLTVVAAGCSGDATQQEVDGVSTARVFDDPFQHEIFEPYQGAWKFEDLRFDPPLTNSEISGGSDVSVNGHTIRFGSGILIRELRLCQARETGDGVAAEAWHHEDIHDPGDMQRAECKLRIKDDRLEIQWRIVDFELVSDDPVIASDDYAPPVRQGDSDLLPWWILTYSCKASN